MLWTIQMQPQPAAAVRLFRFKFKANKVNPCMYRGLLLDRYLHLKPNQCRNQTKQYHRVNAIFFFEQPVLFFAKLVFEHLQVLYAHEHAILKLLGKWVQLLIVNLS